MFLHLSVNHSVHRWHGVHPLGRHPPGQTLTGQTRSGGVPDAPLDLLIYCTSGTSGGSKGHLRRAPPRTKLFLISCSFWENLYVGAFPWRVVALSYGKSWIPPPGHYTTKGVYLILVVWSFTHKFSSMNSVLLIERTHHLDMKSLAAKNISVAIIKKVWKLHRWIMSCLFSSNKRSSKDLF